LVSLDRPILFYWASHRRSATRKNAGRVAAKLLKEPKLCAVSFGRCLLRWNGRMARGHLLSAQSNEYLSSLLQAVAAGDRKAFRTLYDNAVPVLFGICVRLMRDRDLAQDLLQEAMTRIWRKAHLFDASKGNAMAWMAVVTRNCALSRIAAATPLAASLDEADVLAAVESRPAGDPVTAADVRQCLMKLNEKYRKCVILIYLHGLSYEELATQMGAPLGSVKSWVHRAIGELAKCMDK
jgi:RNA polymerase sigma-70 factor, ECF subfamily